jgi:hypothetical protein
MIGKLMMPPRFPPVFMMPHTAMVSPPDVHSRRPERRFRELHRAETGRRYAIE